MKHKKFVVSEKVKTTLSDLALRISNLSTDNAYSLLFGAGTKLSPQDSSLLLPEVFALESVHRARIHYDLFGFVVFDVQNSSDLTPEEQKFRTQCGQFHLAQIYEYLKKFNINMMDQGVSKQINAIRRKKEFPAKLNLGIIGGTLYQSSVNRHTEPSNSSTMDVDELYDSEEEMEIHTEPSSKLSHLDDYISQSFITWVLRHFCLKVYQQLFQIKEEMLASVEDSTCMFSNLSHWGTLQSDKLHFLPKVFASDTYCDARGFLSITEGDSFVTIPYFHTVFQTLYDNMKTNHYLNKRTATRAIPPEQYGLENDKFSKRILLKPGQYLIYNSKALVQFKEQRISLEPHIGLNVMFFDPKKRHFTSADHQQRIWASMTNYVVNDERVFGHTFFTKRRGTQYLLKGTFQPDMNKILCSSFLQQYPYYENVKKIIHHLDI